MRSALIALLCLGWQAGVLRAAAPCSIQRAAAAEPHVWLLCDQRHLFVSPDRGATWQARRLPADVELRAVAMLDARRGFIAGDGGTLLATTDGAETWRRVPVPTGENLTSIHFAGELGWISGWSGVILHSPDGGRNWERQDSGIQQGLESVYFADPRHGWAVGWVGAILRTADGGRTWERVRTPSTLWSLDAVYFRDPKQGWAVGFGGLILASDDGGETWRQQESPVQAWLRSVVFDHAGRGWIGSDNGLLVSDDGGGSWRYVPVENTVFIHQVLPLSDSVWAVGQFGVLRQTDRSPKLTILSSLPASAQRENRAEN